MDVGLMFFGDVDTEQAGEHYETLLDAARLADELGVRAIWTPERHYHPFGGYFPDPAVLSAAIAQVTSRTDIRAGSVVAPLHDAMDVVERWSVVDNLSRGRVGLALASGWSELDYWRVPDRFDRRGAITAERVHEVRALWSGDEQSITTPSGAEARIRAFPRPHSREVPLWLTTKGDRDGFLRAAGLGTGVLTHMLGHAQTLDALGDDIRAYREAWAGDPSETGHVAVMVHTLVCAEEDQAWSVARPALTRYLRSALDLDIRGTLHEGLSERRREQLAALKLRELSRRCTMVGDPTSIAPVVRALHEAGVDEVVCLVDFVQDRQLILEELPLLLDAVGTHAGS